MISTSLSRVGYFEQTSDGSYDRHTYELVLKDGHVIPFESYEEMRATWFHQYPLKQFSHVLVKDKNKGFQ